MMDEYFKRKFEELIKNFSKDRNIAGFQKVVYTITVLRQQPKSNKVVRKSIFKRF